jgi:hypothetical protein
MTGWVSPTMGAAEYEKLNAIEPGIPPYMRSQVAEWMVNVAFASYYGDPDVPKLLALAFKDSTLGNARNFPAKMASLSSDQMVSIIDWMLYFDIKSARPSSDDLGQILDIGRAEWKLSDMDPGCPRLVRRIPAGVEKSYEDVVSKTGAAGSLLAEAFNAVYGASPNPDSAYGLSVKAVETLACPKFLPKNGRATLGTIITHLEQKTLSLPLREGNVPDGPLIVSMMRKLWAGGERHGSTTYQHVSQEGAKAALSLAVSLVSMIHEDIIAVS